MESLETRFWSKVDRSGECWLWTDAPSSNGYGYVKVDGKRRRAHRVAWELTNGPIPKGKGYHGTCVLHRCDVRLCVNPAHLFLGTNAENIADRETKGRGWMPRYRGADCAWAKITEAQVVEIRAASGPQTAISARFGISQQQVSRIRAGKRWAHQSPSLNTSAAAPNKEATQ